MVAGGNERGRVDVRTRSCRRGSQERADDAGVAQETRWTPIRLFWPHNSLSPTGFSRAFSGKPNHAETGAHRPEVAGLKKRARSPCRAMPGSLFNRALEAQPNNVKHFH